MHNRRKITLFKKRNFNSDDNSNEPRRRRRDVNITSRKAISEGLVWPVGSEKVKLNS